MKAVRVVISNGVEIMTDRKITNPPRKGLATNSFLFSLSISLSCFCFSEFQRDNFLSLRNFSDELCKADKSLLIILYL
ncbi:MAG: hypothetical protein ACK4F9_07295 [Brevinematia bacterium]